MSEGEVVVGVVNKIVEAKRDGKKYLLGVHKIIAESFVESLDIETIFVQYGNKFYLILKYENDYEIVELKKFKRGSK